MSNSRGLSHLGLYVYAFGSFAAGVFDLIWGNFDPAHQPLQAWGDNIPGATVFAYITGVGMVAGAVALLGRRSARVGGAVLAAIYLLFALFWLPRFYTAPHYLGFRIPVYIGVFSGLGTELIATAAGVLVHSQRGGGRESSPSFSNTRMGCHSFRQFCITRYDAEAPRVTRLSWAGVRRSRACGPV